MVLTDFLEAGGAALAAVFAGLAFRESHSDRNRSQVDDQIGHKIEPFNGRLSLLEERTSHIPDNIEAAVSRAIQPLLLTQQDLVAKMDIVWDREKALAVDAAKVLHHPEPGRAEIDKLLDAFMEDTLTEEEALRLRKYLVTIRNWEPGDSVGFPVYQGEQMAAAILLRTIDHMISPRGGKDEESAGARGRHGNTQ